MQTKPSILFQWLCATAILTGCGSTPNREVRFHEESGLTWASMDEPVVLARSTPQYTVAARDYIYIGPVETNSLGELVHHLWLGIGSTVDRELRGERAPDSSTLVLVVDGTPIAFPLHAWEAEFEASPYEAQVPITGARGVRVSLDQIQWIAQADSVEVQVVSESGSTARYELWEGSWLSWVDFPAERIERELDARTETAAVSP